MDLLLKRISKVILSSLLMNTNKRRKTSLDITSNALRKTNNQRWGHFRCRFGGACKIRFFRNGSCTSAVGQTEGATVNGRDLEIKPGYREESKRNTIEKEKEAKKCNNEGVSLSAVSSGGGPGGEQNRHHAR